ncbi:MAG: HNH endonuclease [Bacteroidales bacterium]|nr:HNH endonuclease [Bacteroidales bacterium]
MIKLQLIAKPAELTDEVKQQLTEKFKQDGSPVWKKPYIERALLEMTNSKCAYSEQLLNTKSSYMEIDHFKHKDKYKDLVVEWGNLLPSCKKCNTTKGNHDVVAEPIVNPLTDNPKDFLYVKAFKYYPKNQKGEITRDVLALNDREHFINPRSEMGFTVAENLENLFDLLKSTSTERQKRNCISKIKSVLESCRPKYEYSAVISTYILYEDETFKELETYLRDNNLWDSEFEEIKAILTEIAMPE